MASAVDTSSSSTGTCGACHGAAAGHAFSPFSSRRKRAMSFRSSGMRASLRSSFGFQIWKVSPVPRNSASSLKLALAAHHRRQDDAARAVVRHLFGRGERHQVALLIFELRVGARLFFFEQALQLGVLQRGVSGVVGAEAGEGVVLGEDDRAGIASALDHGAQEGRARKRDPSRPPRSAHCPETDAQAPRSTPRSQRAASPIADARHRRASGAKTQALG